MGGLSLINPDPALMGASYVDCLEARPVRPPEETTRLQEEIIHLKASRKAIILAHNYQVSDIQDMADFVGDSLGLSRKAAETDAETILFCGVHFMAETAKIVNPERKVLLPDLHAGCSLADSCDAGELEAYRRDHPDDYIIAYINCTAAVKAQCDIICTSGNAVKVVQQAPKGRPILFLPDENLGQWVIEKTGREMNLWPGACHTHLIFTADAIQKLKYQFPDAPVVAHPECPRAVRLLADHVCSTEGMVTFSRESPSDTLIVVTESGMLHRLKREIPDKRFIPGPTATCACNDCGFMKMNTLEKVYHALDRMEPEIHLTPELIQRARIPIERMLQIR